MRLWQTNPFQPTQLISGNGCTVWDTEGKPYVDLLSGTWCSVLGHGHPRWRSAIADQAARLAHTGAAFISREVDGALLKLREILPPQLDRAVFLNTGSEAVELALKMARAATGADGIVVIERGYYGATTYALALSEAGRTATYLPKFGDIYRIPAPTCRRCPVGYSWPCGDNFSCVESLAGLLEIADRKISAVLYEPVMGGGIVVPPIGYGARLRELAHNCGALLIAEEVTTGMGRTGRWFGFEHDQILPDILVIGKAIGAGLPVSAVVTTADVEIRCRGALRHVQSHQNDPLSGRIAATVISILQEERLVERAADQGGYLLAGLRKLQSDFPCLWDVRGRGLMLGVELGPECSNKGPEISRRLFEAGFITDFHPPSSTFRFFPPFIISTREVDSFIEAFKKTLRGI